MLRADYPGQYCSIAKSLEVIGERWSLLIVRDILNGHRRFSELQSSLGIARNERKRLNRNDFSDFAGVLNRLFQRPVCLSVNLWALLCKPSCPSLSSLFKQVETTSPPWKAGLTG